MWRKAGPGKAARFITGYSDATGVCAGALMAPPGVVATPKGGSGPAEPRATNRTQEGGGNCHAGSACDDLLPHALPSGPVMTVRNFDSLLKPASVALLGASPKTGSVGSIVAQNLRRGGFAGPIWFVNPKYQPAGRPSLLCLGCRVAGVRPISPCSQPHHRQYRH